jgi:hypothetical protein
MLQKTGVKMVVDKRRALLNVPLPNQGGASKSFSMVAVGRPWCRCRSDHPTHAGASTPVNPSGR